MDLCAGAELAHLARLADVLEAEAANGYEVDDSRGGFWVIAQSATTVSLGRRVAAETDRRWMRK